MKRKIFFTVVLRPFDSFDIDIDQTVAATAAAAVSNTLLRVRYLRSLETYRLLSAAHFLCPVTSVYFSQ